MNQPNATLYVSNIDWKIKKPILKRALHTLFNRHGKILEIIILRKEGLRGQAWVIFSSITTATAALQAEQNFVFFGKPLKIDYANEKSDRIAKRDGTYVPNHERRKMNKEKRELEQGGEGTAGNSGGDYDNGNEGGGGKKLKLDDTDGTTTVRVDDTSKLMNDQHTTTITTATNNNTSNISESSSSPPSNILFAESLPKDCNEMMLACLFRNYPGYKESRIPRSGLAFIEFDDEPHATVALKALNGFNLSESETLNLKYGKTA